MSVYLTPSFGAGYQGMISAGMPNSGGMLYTYLAGTTTPSSTYTTAAANIFNPNPIVLDASGRIPNSAEMWQTGGVAIKVLVKDAAGNTLQTQDDLQGTNDPVFSAFSPGTSGYIPVSNGTQLIPTSPDPGILNLLGNQAPIVTSITALRARVKTANPWVLATGYYASGDGGGGLYYYVASDTTSTDNGGTIIVGADGGRWYLEYQGLLSVRQFGAKGDGVTNDTAAIQKTINSLGSSGGTVFFPRGSYMVGALSFTRSWVRLLGEGYSSQMSQIASTNASMLTIGDNSTYVTGNRVENLWLIGNSAGQTVGSGIVLQGCENTTIQGVQIKDFRQYGIQAGGAVSRLCPYINIYNCYVNTNVGEGIVLGTYAYTADIVGNLIAGSGWAAKTGGAGVHIISNDTHRIVGNVFDNNDYGINISNSSSIGINGNVFEQHGRDFISSDNTSHHISICGNSFIDCSQDSAGTWKGIELGGSYNAVTGNTFSQVSNTAANAIVELAGSTNNIVHSNTINTANFTGPVVSILSGSGSSAKNNIGYNPVGVLGPPAVPASTVAYTNNYGVDCMVYVSAGTVTQITIGALGTNLISGAFLVAAGQTIAITYTVAPAWRWFGL